MQKTIQQLQEEIYAANVAKGFWNHRLGIPQKMADSGLFSDQEVEAVRKAFKAQQLALITSEVSEALEADRKDLMDDKLPQYKGFDVELVDGLIRTLDYMGANNVPTEEILQAKMEYNAKREYMHGGKAY